MELAFAINLGAVTKLHRRTAVVAHVSRGGTGLMMDAYTAQVVSSIFSYEFDGRRLLAGVFRCGREPCSSQP